MCAIAYTNPLAAGPTIAAPVHVADENAMMRGNPFGGAIIGGMVRSDGDLECKATFTDFADHADLGAAIPAIEVSLASDRTGFQRTTRTNESGLFAFPDLTPAVFTLKIAAPGFTKYEQTGIEITSGAQRSLGAIELKIGQTSESVTVEAEAVAVSLGSSEKAGTLSAADIEAMALKGRDIMDAVALLPGIVDTSDSRDAPSPTSIGNLYIAGSSVFPTAGANFPTITLTALALRMAEHLAIQLKDSRRVLTAAADYGTVSANESGAVAASMRPPNPAL